MKKALFNMFSGLSLYLLPVVAFAQTDNIADLGDRFFEVINNVLIPLIFAIAFLWFLWGVFLYVFYSQEEDSKTKARENMIWGIIALFIMFSVWGLVRLLVNTTGTDNSVPTDLPVIPGNR